MPQLMRVDKLIEVGCLGAANKVPTVVLSHSDSQMTTGHIVIAQCSKCLILMNANENDLFFK